MRRRSLLALAALAGCRVATTEAPRPRSVPQGQAPPKKVPEKATREEGSQEAATEADLMADYLAAACRSDGTFVYRINLDPEIPVGSRYNVLRHAGAIYALADYQARFPRPTIAAAIVRARAGLERFIAPVPGRPDLAAVWSHDDPEEAKLGGAGLALVALVGAQGDDGPLRALGRFIAFMQKPDGSFHSKLFAGEGPDDDWVSLYYPGEAALGLVMLHERDGAGGFGAVAKRGLLFLATSRRHQRRLPPDHWALIATDRLLSRSADLASPAERETLVAHSRQVALSMLDARAQHPPSSPRHGSFTPDGRTTPTATRLEGLLAARRHVAHPELERAIDEAVDAGIAFLLRALVREGPHRGAMPRAIERLAEESADFNRRATEVRIDYVQHALSAILGAR